MTYSPARGPQGPPGAANFDSYTRATLPSPDAALVVNVTDGIRGLWRGNGLDWVPANQHVLDVRDYGARCDDSTDDAAAIQAAIDAAGDTTIVRRSGVVVLIPGPCAIGSTLLVDGKSIEIRGLGFGHQGAAAGITNPPKSYLRWIGAAGVPMLRIQDSFDGARVSNLRFIGHTTNKPDSAISFYESNDSIPNQRNILENIFIGVSDVGEPVGAENQFENGIRFEGAVNFNNAEMAIRMVTIRGCDEYGIRVGSTQNVFLHFEGLFVSKCKYGVMTPTILSGANWFFASNTEADFEFPFQDDFSGTALGRVSVKSFGSEGSKRLAVFKGAGHLSIEGGYWQISSSTAADGQIIGSSNNADDMLGSSSVTFLRLVDFEFTQATAPPTPPYLHIRSRSGGATFKSIILDQVRGWGFLTGGTNGLDVATRSSTDRRYIYFREYGSASPRIAQNFLADAPFGSDWDIGRYQNQATRFKVLAESTDTDLFSVSVPNGTSAVGYIDYTIKARDATNSQAKSGRLRFSATANSSGVVTAAALVEEGTQNPVTSGTLTCTFVQATATNLLTIKANAVSSLTQTLLEAHYNGPQISSGPANLVTIL